MFLLLFEKTLFNLPREQTFLEIHIFYKTRDQLAQLQFHNKLKEKINYNLITLKITFDCIRYIYNSIRSWKRNGMTFVNANDVKNYIWHSYNSINELQRNDMTFVNANYVKGHSHILGLNSEYKCKFIC